jgi:hypothetical protein
MTGKLYLLLAVLLASGILAAGCGGDDDNGGGGGDGDASNPQVKQAVARCKQSVDQAQRLSGSVKEKLRKTCEDAARGDQEAVRKATREVCVEIVEQNVPAGPAREQAKAACQQGTSQ